MQRRCSELAKLTQSQRKASSGVALSRSSKMCLGIKFLIHDILKLRKCQIVNIYRVPLIEAKRGINTYITS